MALKKQDESSRTIVDGHAVTLVDDQSEDIPTAETTASATSTTPSIGPAAAAGGVIGFLLGGPIFGIVLGLGSGYASTRQGVAGDAARASGDVAVLVKEKATEINEEHQLSRKITDTARRFCNFVRNRGDIRSTPVAQDDNYVGN